MKPKDVARQELIGLEVEIADSTNPEAVGAKGRVIDETRNMLVVETDEGGEKKEKKFVKEQCTFIFTLPTGGQVKIDGKLLVARPEDRIKKKLKKW